MSDGRFVVSRIEWVKSESASDPYLPRTLRTARVAAFATFDEADADRAAREVEARGSIKPLLDGDARAFEKKEIPVPPAPVNPFLFGGEALFYQTSLDAPQLHDWLMDAGIEPPTHPPGHTNWAIWWSANVSSWSAEQLAHAWAALDKVRFFEVTEELPAKAFVIIELNWNWEDESTLQADYEGGNVVRGFRSRVNAEAECARLNRERQAQTEHNGYGHFTRNTRAGQEGAGSLGIEETIFFEVVEVELGGDA